MATYYSLSLLVFAASLVVGSATQAQDGDSGTMHASTSVQVMPGLSVVPATLWCCPAVPLIGPTWRMDLSSLSSSSSSLYFGDDNCSFFSRQQQQQGILLLFQPSGHVNGWADENACHSFQASYQVFPEDDPAKTTTTTTSTPFEVTNNKQYQYQYQYQYQSALHWNQWKSQPYSCPPKNCQPQQIETFFQRLASRVVSIGWTDYTTVELRDSRNQVVLRLEAIPSSYHCSTNDAFTMTGTSMDGIFYGNQQEEECAPILKLPNPTLSNILAEDSPHALVAAAGGGGGKDGSAEVSTTNSGATPSLSSLLLLTGLPLIIMIAM